MAWGEGVDDRAGAAESPPATGRGLEEPPGLPWPGKGFGVRVWAQMGGTWSAPALPSFCQHGNPAAHLTPLMRQLPGLAHPFPFQTLHISADSSTILPSTGPWNVSIGAQGPGSGQGAAVRVPFCGGPQLLLRGRKKQQKHPLSGSSMLCSWPHPRRGV